MPAKTNDAWIKADASAIEPASPDTKPCRLILLGAPGVGKGTQAELLSKETGARQLSTGDVFRAAKSTDESERTPALNEALDFMKQGALVPDETVVGIVRERAHCLRDGKGFLLDGFPRTVAQAEALEGMLQGEGVSLDAVVSYDLPIDTIVSRLGGRRTCEKCKAVFHVETIPPKVEGVCDHCGGNLFQREDDRPESIRVRMDAYEKSTKPLADYYAAKGLLLSVSADGAPQEIYDRTAKALEEKKGA